MTAKQALTAKMAALSTEALVELSLRFTVAVTNEQIVVCTFADRELESRLSEVEFAEHIAAVEMLLDVAA